MGNSMIKLGTGEILLDLRSDTVTAATLLAGITAHAADGSQITGNYAASKLAMGFTDELSVHTATLRIDGIQDSNGESFTPTGYVLMRYNNAVETEAFDAAGLMMVFCNAEGTGSNKVVRVSLYDGRQLRYNNANLSGTVGDGYIRYTTGMSTYYLLPGTYFWIAWATDAAQARGLMSAAPEEISGEEER
ncbi:MAG: hypothetical protein IJK23_10025 [Clostridia bacterium]|nr:hypothetical protein [Clostridia bacterium]